MSEEDVDESINLIEVALQRAATDPETGIINMDILTTGKSSSAQRRVESIVAKLKEIFKANAGKYKKNSKVDDVREDLDRVWEAQAEAIRDEEVHEAMKVLQSEDLITLFGSANIKRNFRLVKNLHDV